MPNRIPKSYDEITRHTVPEPDGSWRPSDAQEIAAFEGFRALDRSEQELSDRVSSALSSSGRGLQNVSAEVEGDRVVLRGAVRNAAAIGDALDVVSRVDGVREVVDRLVVSAD